MAGAVTGVVAGVVAGDAAAAVPGATAALALGTPGADAGAAAAKFIELDAVPGVVASAAGIAAVDGDPVVVVVVPGVAGVLSPSGNVAAEVRLGVGFANAFGATAPAEPALDKSVPRMLLHPWLDGFSCWFCAATCDVKSSPVESPKSKLKMSGICAFIKSHYAQGRFGQGTLLKVKVNWQLSPLWPNTPMLILYKCGAGRVKTRSLLPGIPPTQSNEESQLS
jgi:hypothetical protein